jgi:hypothetical protein
MSRGCWKTQVPRRALQRSLFDSTHLASNRKPVEGRT